VNGRFVTIPTREITFSTQHLCYSILASDAVPVILVPDGHNQELLPEPTIVVVRQGASFDSWINEGLDEVLTRHDDPRVVVLNDDMTIPERVLDPMFDALLEHDLVGLSGWEQTVTPSPLRGHLFGLRAKTMRMPEDPALALWWWGTDDLYHQAVADGRSISFVPVLYSHVSDNERGDGSWRYPVEFQWSVQADHDYFWSKWSHLDPEHQGCYLSWWPAAIPDGQTHRTEWA
jgi:hypothetical protein